MTIQVLTKFEIENKLKEQERKLSNQINRRVNQRINEKKTEEAKLDKDKIKQQEIKDKKEWGMVKNKEERLLALEQENLGIKDYLRKFAEQFNDHVEKNNDDFEKITGGLNK